MKSTCPNIKMLNLKFILKGQEFIILLSQLGQDSAEGDDLIRILLAPKTTLNPLHCILKRIVGNIKKIEHLSLKCNVDNIRRF